MDLITRFMKYVLKTETCWLWQGAVHYGGYGHFQWKKGWTKRAHRAAWEIFRGIIPDGFVICHKCDIKRCVNPDHLFLGTQYDNVQDQKQKGRLVKSHGETHYNAKLTYESVQAIRALYSYGTTTQRKLATQYGVRQSYISALVKGQKRKES